MKNLFSWNELAEITHGRWILPSASKRRGITHITMDSREVKPTEAFLAYRGDNHDSHDFLDQIASRRAAAAIVDRPLPDDTLALLRASGVACLLVADTLTAYQQLGAANRLRYPDLVVVGITGSSGKTSTKEIIRKILNLSWTGQVLATKGNTNNLIGVPRNLLRITNKHRAAVIEMGTNAPGEIPTLAQLVAPTISVLTSVGPVHLEGLGDIDGVAREKAAIFTPLDRQTGHAVLPHTLAQDPIIREQLPEHVTTVGLESDADITVECLSSTLEFTDYSMACKDPQFNISGGSNLLGAHQGLNAALGMAVGLAAGLNGTMSFLAISHADLPKMRQQVELRDGITWINDAYNANPDSTRAMLDWLVGLDDGCIAGRLILCLGDMLEMGHHGPSYHLATLKHAQAKHPQASLMPIGPLMSAAAAELGIPAWESAEAARPALHDSLQPSDTVALKGSRGMHLEALL